MDVHPIAEKTITLQHVRKVEVLRLIKKLSIQNEKINNQNKVKKITNAIISEKNAPIQLYAHVARKYTFLASTLI